MDNLAFEIFTIKNGKKDKVWRIYFDGRTEGFKDVCVTNEAFTRIQVLKYFAQNMNKTYRDFMRRCILSDFFPVKDLNLLYETFKKDIERI